MQINDITFAGYVGGDAKSGATQTGKESVQFSLCHTKKTDRGEESTWVQVQVYGAWVGLATGIRKGDNVVVKGLLQVKQYKDRAGVDKTWVSIFAHSLGIVQREDKAAPIAPTAQVANYSLPPNTVSDAIRQRPTAPVILGDELDQIPF